MDPTGLSRLRRRIRVFLIAGFSSLLGILLALGLYAGLTLEGLAHQESAATQAFLKRAELLDAAQRGFSEAGSALGRYLVEPNETALDRHRQVAQRTWAEATRFIQDYGAIAGDREQLLQQSARERERYWTQAEKALKLAGRERAEAGPRLHIESLAPMRNEFMATFAELSAQDRQWLTKAAAAAAGAAEREKHYLWVVMAIACLLSAGVAAFTFRHVVALENIAAEQFDKVARSAQELRRLSERLVQSQEEERRKIARDLHDDFGQRLASLIFEWTTLSEKPEVPAAVKDTVDSAVERLGAVAKDLQRVSHSLHPAVLERIGLAAAIRADCDALRARTSMNIDFQAEGVPRRIAPETALALYRVSQEAIQNALKHARTERLDVSLRLDGTHLILRVQDFGCGFDAAPQASEGGLGMVSIRERLRMVQGGFSVSSKPGQGTVVEARVPLAADSTAAAQHETAEVKSP